MADFLTPRLNVLCLHGYRQNETVFKERSGAFRKMLKKHMNFVFLSAPHELPEPANLARTAEARERGWWFSRSDRSYSALDVSDVCIGFEESVQLVKEMCEKQGPFDGLLGFSQGAAFTSLLCAMAQNSSGGLHLQFKFALLIAGFKSLLSAHSCLYLSPVDMPTFHVIGVNDRVIPIAASEDLVSFCKGAVAYRHSGGHYMPACPDLRSNLLHFLEPFAAHPT